MNSADVWQPEFRPERTFGHCLLGRFLFLMISSVGLPLTRTFFKGITLSPTRYLEMTIQLEGMVAAELMRVRTAGPDPWV